MQKFNMQKISYLPNLFLLAVALCAALVVAEARAHTAFEECHHTIDVTVNDYTYEYFGKGNTRFVNNSGDTLHQLFFHVYFNAFQHNSELAAYAVEHGANDFAERLRALTAEQEGRLDIDSCTVDGQPATTERTGTVVRIDLAQPLLPGRRIDIAFAFSGRIPWLCRRAGRNNTQSIRYSMAQWYPKLCQYDQHGWHNNQYLFREFFGVFASYDVRITLPARYVVGATGTLQNPREVGHGYQFTTDTTIQPSQQLLTRDSLLTWHFRAEQVHDFAWVADENYAHTIAQHGATTIHVLHDSSLTTAWKPVAEWCKRTLDTCGGLLGTYPYASFTCAQAGDGGMEYPQLIMIQHRAREPLLRVVIHEIVHQWFYGLVANNETLHAWLDEGFTEYLEHRIATEVFPEEQPLPKPLLQRWLVPQRSALVEKELSYFNIVRAGFDEPMARPHDRFGDFAAAWLVYDKGMAFLHQLEYSFGRPALDSCLKLYAAMWRFAHPSPQDFERLCEQVFAQRMDEIFDIFTHTTHRPDYSIESLLSSENNGVYTTHVGLRRHSPAHVPLVLYVRLASGAWITHRIPSDMSYRHTDTAVVPWLWTRTEYTAELRSLERVEEVLLDTTFKLLDLTAEDNTRRNRLLLSGLPPLRFGLWQRYDQAVPLHYYGISVRPSLWRFAPSTWQVGIRADGLIDFNRYRTTLGLYAHTPGTVDWQAAFSHPFPLLARSTYTARAWSMDGTRHASLSLAAQHQQQYGVPERWTLSVAAEYWRGTDATLFRTFGDLYRTSVSALYEWRSGSFAAEVSAASNSLSGAQATTVLRWTTSRTSNSALHLRLFATAATPLLPREQWYSLRTATVLEQFNNTPYRFASGIAPTLTAAALFLPGGAGFAENATPARNVLACSIALREWYPLQLGLPVFDVLEAGAYAAFAVAGNSNSDFRSVNSAVHCEAGFLLSVDLNDIAPFAQALWIFAERPCIGVYIPIVRKAADTALQTGTRGFKLGIGTTL